MRWMLLALCGLMLAMCLGCAGGFKIPSFDKLFSGGDDSSDPTGTLVTYGIFVKFAWWMMVPGVLLIIASALVHLPTGGAGWTMVGIGAGAAVLPMILGSTWGGIILGVGVAIMAVIGIWKALQISGLLEKRKACHHVLQNEGTQREKRAAKKTLADLESRLDLHRWPEALKRKVTA